MAEVKTETAQKQRNIYEKMAVVKTKLVGLKKGGKNDFSHYSYFELGDILPVLTPALREEGLYMKTQFSATEQIAKLIIIDIDNTESLIEFEIRFAECALKGAHEIQNLGAAQTYTRRYLIMTAFDIAEADIVDAGAEKDDKKPEKKNWQTSTAQKAQQAAANPPPAESQKEMEALRRQTWELIKKLPKEEQTEWINACKGADKAKLNQIISDVNAKLNAKTQETTPPQPTTEDQRLENLRTELFTLIETLPEEVRAGWLDAAYYADEARIENLLCEIKQKTSTLEEVRKPKETPEPQQTTTANPGESQTAPADADLEIF